MHFRGKCEGLQEASSVAIRLMVPYLPCLLLYWHKGARHSLGEDAHAGLQLPGDAPAAAWASNASKSRNEIGGSAVHATTAELRLRIISLDYQACRDSDL